MPCSPHSRHLRPGCATTDPRLTIVCGVVAAFVYHYTYRLQLDRGLDDAVNAVPVHLFCGFWGLLSAAFMFAPGRHDVLMSAYGVDESRGSCGRANQIAANLLFAFVVVAWVSGCCETFGRGAHHAASTVGPNNRKQRLGSTKQSHSSSRTEPSPEINQAQGGTSVFCSTPMFHATPIPGLLFACSRQQRRSPCTTSSGCRSRRG